MDPLVSVVIPTYDRSRETARAVGGVVAQTYPAERLEIIVVDDGSKDPAALAVALAPFTGRVQLLAKPNGGVSSARNHGVRHATGVLIAFLDSDDLWRPDKTSKQVDALARHPDWGMVLCDMDVVDGDGRFLAGAPRRAQLPRDGMILNDVLLHPRLGPSSVLIRRGALDAIGLFDESLRTAEDVDFLLRAARAIPIGVVEEPLALYTRQGGASALSANETSWADYMRVMRAFVARHARELDPGVAHRALLRAGLRNARGLAAAGRVREAARLYVEAALHMRDAPDLADVAKSGARIAASVIRTQRPRRR